jgi:hypothetical protein
MLFRKLFLGVLTALGMLVAFLLIIGALGLVLVYVGIFALGMFFIILERGGWFMSKRCFILVFVIFFIFIFTYSVNASIGPQKSPDFVPLVAPDDKGDCNCKEGQGKFYLNKKGFTITVNGKTIVRVKNIPSYWHKLKDLRSGELVKFLIRDNIFEFWFLKESLNCERQQLEDQWELEQLEKTGGD